MNALAVSLVALAATVGFLLGLVAAGGTPTESRRGVVTPASLETRPLSIRSGAESVIGVMLSDVDVTGPARLARLRRGQVVIEINRQRIGSAAQFQRVGAGLPRRAAVAVYVFDPVTDQRAIYSVIIESL